MSLRTTLCTTCGYSGDTSNAPHTICANSHTHKADHKKLPPTPKGVAGASTPPGPVPDCGLGIGITGQSEARGGPQGGPWWSAVDAAVDLQEESQLLSEAQGALEPSEQLPLFPPTPYPRNTSTQP